MTRYAGAHHGIHAHPKYTHARKYTATHVGRRGSDHAKDSPHHRSLHVTAALFCCVSSLRPLRVRARPHFHPQAITCWCCSFASRCVCSIASCAATSSPDGMAGAPGKSPSPSSPSESESGGESKSSMGGGGEGGGPSSLSDMAPGDCPDIALAKGLSSAMVPNAPAANRQHTLCSCSMCPSVQGAAEFEMTERNKPQAATHSY